MEWVYAAETHRVRRHFSKLSPRVLAALSEISATFVACTTMVDSFRGLRKFLETWTFRIRILLPPRRQERQVQNNIFLFSLRRDTPILWLRLCRPGIFVRFEVTLRSPSMADSRARARISRRPGGEESPKDRPRYRGTCVRAVAVRVLASRFYPCGLLMPRRSMR